VSPTVSLDDVEKRKFLTLPGLELRPLGRQARSQQLSRLVIRPVGGGIQNRKSAFSKLVVQSRGVVLLFQFNFLSESTFVVLFESFRMSV
jgi:hypothetical protein